ncbi:MAG: tRNA epoxyqueuosine(34) reductase QueG [Gemmatimonadetes bacterium]|nr:tRNA epoxyqueuosine(34) reductase QueG [Gemmatimonadota bacterium]
MNPARELSGRIRDEARRLGFYRSGITPIRESDHAGFYRAWIGRGLHGSMAYLGRPDAIDARTDPGRRWPDLKSAVVVAHAYAAGAPEGGRDGDPDEDVGPDRGVIARYARGRDYHKVVKNKLMELLRFVEAETGRELATARAYVDTGPVLERELARRAGIGWFGRNTMLIDPKGGSYFFLGSLLLPFELDYDAPFEADRCGTCNACVDACPTGALLGRDENGAPVMDATRCISYLTIENRGPIPRELRPAIGNRIYGCDICQERCPFNIRFAEESSQPDYAARGPGQPPARVEALSGSAAHPGTDSPPLIDLLKTALDEVAWDSFSRGSAIRRAGRAGFARNVCVGLGNWGSPEAVPVLVAALRDPEPLVRGHSAWALGRVGSAEAREALERSVATEDPYVRVEIERALETSPIEK